MIKKELNLNVKVLFGNYTRPKAVLIAFIKDSKIIVCTKKTVYPPAIYRFFGGGIENNENFLEGAIRETKEETGLTIEGSRFEEIALFDINATDSKGQKNNNQIALFKVVLNNDEKILASDDTDGVKILDVKGFKLLLSRMRQIQPCLWRYDADTGYEFCWQDWAKLFVPIHEMLLNSTNSNFK